MTANLQEAPEARSIHFTYVGASNRDKRYAFTTLKAAQRKAELLVGPSPKLDPDGYAVHRVTGNCLFFQGVTFLELFPDPHDPSSTSTK